MKSAIFSAALLSLCAACSNELVLSPNGGMVETHNEIQRKYLAMGQEERINGFSNHTFRAWMSEAGGFQQPVKLSWQGISGKAMVTLMKASDGSVVFQEIATNEVEVENLEIGCKYNWTVQGAGKKGEATFETAADAPRFLHDKHVRNLRDLGGWRTQDGKRVKQNMIFRSAGLNGNAHSGKVTDAELAEADPNGYITKFGKINAGRLAEIEEMLAGKREFKLVKFTMPTVWKKTPVEVVGGISAAVMAAASEFPEGGEDVVPGDNGVIKLGERNPGKWYRITATLVAEEDGYALVGMSADWFWSLSVNGELVRDFLGGNDDAPLARAKNICLPVKKGENKLGALVGSGSDNFFARFIPGMRLPDEVLLKEEQECAKWLMPSLTYHSKTRVPGTSLIIDDNRSFWTDVLKVKTDLDVRSDGEVWGMTGSPIGPTAQWIHLPASAYSGLFSEKGKAMFAAEFKVFLDEKNYPIDFHCIGGQDRTGCIATILNGLLGVAPDDLYKDWEATGFSSCNPGVNHGKLYNTLIDGFKQNHPAETLNESIEKYVLSAGFTAEDIAHFRAIMIDEGK